MDAPRKKKLIETGIPLTDINRESAREKSLRHGLPSTLHLYWARRPLATTRTILFAQLVDDPSEHPDRFPTKDAQDVERRRLQDIMSRLAKWENIGDSKLYADARQAILDSNNGVMPKVLDPFAGGGSIPLEAQRLGCEAHASDLNPLAVILNKAMIDIPARFCDQPSVHPLDDGTTTRSKNRAEGLAEDIRYYGRKLRDLAYSKVGSLYPQVEDKNGQKHTVIAWIWARTVTNPNPANPVQVPLVRSWWLSKKKGHEAWIKPIIKNGEVTGYQVQHNANGPTGDHKGTVISGKGAVSLLDGTPIPLDYIHAEGKAGRLGSQLVAVVVDRGRGRGRLYLDADSAQAEIADTDRPSSYPDGAIANNARWFSTPLYGMTTFASLFTNRQLKTLVTFADSVVEIHDQVLADALAAGMARGESLEDGGNDAMAYADALSVYLALSVSRETDRCSSIASWQNIRENIRDVFARQAIPMTWDYAEANPFSSKSGSYYSQVEWVAEAVENLPAKPQGYAARADAMTRQYDSTVISTDPPYYDNIDYSDLSDYFYIWLRWMLKDILPPLTRRELTPKNEELVANPYRRGGKEDAEVFFTNGFNEVFNHIAQTANTDVPMTVYYAYKQHDDADGSSSGWESLLSGLIKAGWEVTATWPVRSERAGRMISVGTNALASSIVLACRPRPKDAGSISTQRFNTLLRSELSKSLPNIIEQGIQPVDLAQAAIGPGIGVYSRYNMIYNMDGSQLSVSDALKRVNAAVDEILNPSDSDSTDEGLDSDTTFALQWFSNYGWSTATSGDADQLARTNGTSLGGLVRSGIFDAERGKARLLKPAELTNLTWNPETDKRVGQWEAVMRLAGILEKNGATQAGHKMALLEERMDISTVRNLAFRVYHLAEKQNDSQTAQTLNNFVSSWDVMDQIAEKDRSGSMLHAQQQTLAGID